VPQTIRKDICLTLASAGIIIPNISGNTKRPETVGTTIPAMAKPLPFNLPALFPIFTKPIIPKIIAGIAVMKKVQKPNIPSTNDAIASPLVLAAEVGAIVEILVSTELQEWHNWALSGFSLPHFGQYICILLSI
jgi:hypothetical protein